MSRMRLPGLLRAGHSLAELAAVLVTLGIALAIAAPALVRSLDGLGVRSARDAIVQEAARARLLARLHAGASLVVSADEAAVWIEAPAGDTLSGPVHIDDRYHARIDLGGDARAVISYDRLGIGRLANRSVRLVRGEADARLTVSAYGRVRAW